MQDLGSLMLGFREHLPNVSGSHFRPTHPLLIHSAKRVMGLLSAGSWEKHPAFHRLRPESLVIWLGKKDLGVKRDCKSQSCH